MIEKASYWLSGEFLLKKRPNGGGVVLARSIFVTLCFYLAALSLKSITNSDAVLSFSLAELTKEVNGTVPWLGAIFAAVYAAFYTRYSNQWSYLASTYNQLMNAKSTIKQSDAIGNSNLINWQAGFVSDAYTLHLDRKPIFKGVIDHLLTIHEVKEKVLTNFSDEDLDEFKRRHFA